MRYFGIIFSGMISKYSGQIFWERALERISFAARHSQLPRQLSMRSPKGQQRLTPTVQIIIASSGEVTVIQLIYELEQYGLF